MISLLASHFIKLFIEFNCDRTQIFDLFFCRMVFVSWCLNSNYLYKSETVIYWFHSVQFPNRFFSMEKTNDKTWIINIQHIFFYFYFHFFLCILAFRLNWIYSIIVNSFICIFISMSKILTISGSFEIPIWSNHCFFYWQYSMLTWS